MLKFNSRDTFVSGSVFYVIVCRLIYSIPSHAILKKFISNQGWGTSTFYLHSSFFFNFSGWKISSLQFFFSLSVCSSLINVGSLSFSVPDQSQGPHYIFLFLIVLCQSCILFIFNTQVKPESLFIKLYSDFDIFLSFSAFLFFFQIIGWKRGCCRA